MSKDPVSLDLKLNYLIHCLKDGLYEDGVGHLIDLMEFCRIRIHSDRGRGRPPMSWSEMIVSYGKEFIPIEQSPLRDFADLIKEVDGR